MPHSHFVGSGPFTDDEIDAFFAALAPANAADAPGPTEPAEPEPEGAGRARSRRLTAPEGSYRPFPSSASLLLDAALVDGAAADGSCGWFCVFCVEPPRPPPRTA